jgi:hypothetical protein
MRIEGGKWRRKIKVGSEAEKWRQEVEVGGSAIYNSATMAPIKKLKKFYSIFKKFIYTATIWAHAIYTQRDYK